MSTRHRRATVIYILGSQSGVRGPPGVLDGVPGGPQLNDSQEPNGPLWVCNSESVTHGTKWTLTGPFGSICTLSELN